MTPAREKAQKKIFALYKKIDLGTNIYNRMVEAFERMSDEVFDDLLTKMARGEDILPIIVPPEDDKYVTKENNYKIAHEYNVPIWEQLDIDDGEIEYRTPQKFMFGYLPFRVQAQSLFNKISIPDNNKVIDQITYQPTGESNGSKLSLPELNIMKAKGLDKCVEELGVFRGGDRGGFAAYNAMANSQGKISLERIAPYRTGVESTKYVKALLASAHLNLKELK